MQILHLCYATSSNAHRSKVSSLKVARWAIIVVACLFGRLYMNSINLFDLKKDNKLQWYISSDTIYKEIYIIIQVCVFVLIVPYLITIFDIITIYNTK
jgi:hypothetical protein